MDVFNGLSLSHIRSRRRSLSFVSLGRQEAGGREERRTLAFRDYLRAHPEIAREYAALKETLAPLFSADDFASQQQYAEAKGAFIESIISVAQAEGYPFDVQSPVA
jgi:GrpB-like predicted nucleotidyltransferase (UPF0157 family)